MKISSEPTRLQTIMFSLNMLFFMLAVTLLTVVSSSSSPYDNYNYDLSGSALTRLYNSPVYLAERMRRPLGNNRQIHGIISHSGVRVTLADKSRWLIHKGKKFGVDGYNTVVTDAQHMSSEWEFVSDKNYNGRLTVAELVSAGGPEYRLLVDNCHWAAGRMMNQ